MWPVATVLDCTIINNLHVFFLYICHNITFFIVPMRLQRCGEFSGLAPNAQLVVLRFKKSVCLTNHLGFSHYSFFFFLHFLWWYNLCLVKFTLLVYSSVSFDLCILLCKCVHKSQSRHRTVPLPQIFPYCPFVVHPSLPQSH